MSETTGGVPMFVCGPTTGCGKLTPMERIASGWITPRNCVHCGKEWRRLPSQEITLTGDLLYAPAAPRREDAAGAEPDLVIGERHYYRLHTSAGPEWRERVNNPRGWLPFESTREALDRVAELESALSTAEREREELADTLRYFVDRFSIQGTADSERYDRALALLARVPSGGEEGR